ncbi:Glutathione S-transferase GST-6.0 [Falsiruegeria litorea R37]|uniref:Glutathione S-transferase GST-6.0 n=1 Tax=Falsiruegeria litorea R37 TaxID=1200284 RepID=A0A1Y5T6T0_9RHOB|nr:glutathione S-transferase [Falsiruegeria litorea]SLN57212.1 Glutathione S-transferase GST-6.0 [Falsiruegeria litorea R37]
MIKVHHLNRSRSLRILWLLEELGIDYQVIRYERDAKTNLAPPELLTVHPLGKSPVVEIDGQMVSESAAIVEVLCALYGPNLVPEAGTPSHWHHLELMHFAEGSVMTPILLNLYVGMLGDAGAPLHPRIQNELTNHFDYMESVLRPSGHFVLDDLSAADIMLSFPASIVGRLGRSSEYPGLTSFTQMIEARPAHVRALEAGGGS